MLSTKSSQLLVIKTAFSCATKLLLACLYTVFLVACVSSGGKSKEQNITQLSDIDLDTVEYAEDSDEVSDERFAAPEQEAEEVANPYDNPQYADSDEVTAPADADVYDAYDNPQSSDEATAEVDSVESTEENISDEVFVAENGLDYSDDSVDESQPVEPEAIVDEPVYEQVGIDENGLPIMAIVEPVDPLEKFGPNPYLQNPPQVSSEAAATFSEALNLMRAEDFEKAAELLELLSDQNPQLSGPAYNRAVIAFKAEDMALTLTWLNISLERNAYNLNAKNLKANVFKQQAKFSEAEEEYKSIIAMWGAYLPAYKNLGILYDMYMGKLALALEQYRLYEALSPEENKQLKGWIAVISRKIEPAPAPVEEPQAVQENIIDESVPDESMLEENALEESTVENNTADENISEGTAVDGNADETESGDAVESELNSSDELESEVAVDKDDTVLVEQSESAVAEPAESQPENLESEGE